MEARDDRCLKQKYVDVGTAVRDEIDRRRGECLKFTGDGYLATFSLCEEALRCAAALQGIAGEYGFAIRCGVPRAITPRRVKMR